MKKHQIKRRLVERTVTAVNYFLVCKHLELVCISLQMKTAGYTNVNLQLNRLVMFTEVRSTCPQEVNRIFHCKTAQVVLCT